MGNQYYASRSKPTITELIVDLNHHLIENVSGEPTRLGGRGFRIFIILLFSKSRHSTLCQHLQTNTSITRSCLTRMAPIMSRNRMGEGYYIGSQATCSSNVLFDWGYSLSPIDEVKGTSTLSLGVGEGLA